MLLCLVATSPNTWHIMWWLTSIKNGQDNDLSEFDESRDIIESLVDEYKACESPDYIKWGMEVGSLQPSYHFKHILRTANYLPSGLGSKQHANGRRQCCRVIGSKISSVKNHVSYNLGFKFLDLVLLSFSRKINQTSTFYKFKFTFFDMRISLTLFFFSLWHVVLPLALICYII